ncbi:MAG: holo-ACP synthase [Betaproteobacteria bacterium]|nr:holo-ACP synthase [Betaproteobacteria bacterium]
MIVGIGVDSVLVRRIRDALTRHGRRFAEKLLTAGELERFDAHAQPARYLAKRFAVKEAFSKALGTGMRHPVTWRHIGTSHDDHGAPTLDLAPELEALVRSRGITRTHVSVTDEEQQAVAFVILEQACADRS